MQGGSLSDASRSGQQNGVDKYADGTVVAETASPQTPPRPATLEKPKTNLKAELSSEFGFANANAIFRHILSV